MSMLTIRFENTLRPKFCIDDSDLKEIREEYIPVIRKLIEELNHTFRFIIIFNLMRWSLWFVGLAVITAFVLGIFMEMWVIFLGLGLLTLWFVMLVVSHGHFAWTVSRLNEVYKKYLPKLTRHYVFSNNVNSEQRSKDPESRMITRFHNFHIGVKPFTLQPKEINVDNVKPMTKPSQACLLISSQPILIKTEMPDPERAKSIASFNKVAPDSIPLKNKELVLQPKEILAKNLQNALEDQR